MVRVSIVWGDGYLSITPAVPVLQQKLRYYHRTMEPDAFNRPVMVGSYRNVFSLDHTVENTQQVVTRMICLPGLLHRITNILREHNIPYTLSDRRTPLPTLNAERALEILRPYQYEGAWTLIQSQGGCLACPTGWGKGAIIASVLRSVDRDNLCARETPLSIVTSPNIEICQNNYKELVKYLPERQVGLHTSVDAIDSDDILVVTTGSLHHVERNDVGILIFDEVHELGSDKRSAVVSEVPKALKWGVSATPTGRFDGGDLVTESVVGPVVYQRTYQDGVREGALVPITVYWLTVGEPPNYGTYVKLGNRKLSRYSRGVKKHPHQCELIADILRRSPEDTQVLAIMENLEQMNAIRERIPDIDIVHAETSNDKLVAKRFHNLYAVDKKERKKIRADFEAGTLKKLMATYVYKQGVNFPNLRVLIFSGGGGSKIASEQIPGRASRKIAGKDEAFIVDFWHPWDTCIDKNTNRNKPGPVFRDDQSRRRTYKKLGFSQIWVDKVDELPFMGQS